MLRRLGAATGVVLASLAFAASAQAAPSAPHLNPIPNYVCGPKPTISWQKSTPDLFGTIVAYRVDVSDLTAGTLLPPKYTAGLSTQIGPLVTGHHYVVRVRALQHRFGVYSWSATSYDHFWSNCLALKLRDEYIEYDPFWWNQCWVCGGLEEILREDPVIYRELRNAAPPIDEQIQGMELLADGSVLVR